MPKDRLSDETRRELARLAERYGTPGLVTARVNDAFFDPIRRPDRFGEVCLVVRRPAGTLVTMTKDFYPAGTFRLPTGGISHGESVLAALLREAREETGLDVELRRFLAWIDYQGAAGAPIFHTFAFLLDETGGTLGALDPHERIAAFGEIGPHDLPALADRLDRIASRLSPEIEGDWADWGRFRAVVHRAVAEALAV